MYVILLSLIKSTCDPVCTVVGGAVVMGGLAVGEGVDPGTDAGNTPICQSPRKTTAMTATGMATRETGLENPPLGRSRREPAGTLWGRGGIPLSHHPAGPPP